MNLFKLSHANPVATVVAFVIVGIMGVAALVNLPVQLTPNLDRPQISIINFWRAAAPAEMEAELVEPEEKVLRAISGLESIRPSVRAGMSITILSFRVGTDMQMKLMDVINAMNQAPSRPRDAEEPMISLGGLEQPLASLLIRKTAAGADGDFTPHQDLIRHSVADVAEGMRRPARGRTRKEASMLGWIVVFVIIALIAGVMGFSGIAGAAAAIVALEALTRRPQSGRRVRR